MMEMTIMIIFKVACCMAWFAFGWVVCSRQKSDGVLTINKSDPDKDSYLFKIDNLDKLDGKKQIKLKIEREI